MTYYLIVKPLLTQLRLYGVCILLLQYYIEYLLSKKVILT